MGLLRRALVAGTLSLALVLAGIAFLFSQAADERGATCQQVNELRGVLRHIVESGDQNLRKLKDEGTITTAQLRRSLQISERARYRLGDKPC